jgi:hypothetical protein
MKSVLSIRYYMYLVPRDHVQISSIVDLYTDATKDQQTNTTKPKNHRSKTPTDKHVPYWPTYSKFGAKTPHGWRELK